MWFSFWRSRERFSLDELRYLTDQLAKIQVINDVNKDFVIEALRSTAELITYGDQHNLAFFEYFMEKQVMGEFVRILKISKTITISLQLLQTISIMIQNLKNEEAIYYMFSNEHINYLITYSFDFRNEELLSYYISFLRAISGKLNKNTISLLIKTQDEEIVSFPLYVEGIRFAFHEESMVRTAVRALTLNIYHVGDESINNYLASAPHGDYFISLVKYFREQCQTLIRLVLDSVNSESTALILSAADEIEDNLYYVSDVISARIPDVGRIIRDAILKFLIFPMLLPSLGEEAVGEKNVVAVTSFYLLCSILRIVKINDLANSVSASLFFPQETFTPDSMLKLNGQISDDSGSGESQKMDNSSDDNQKVLQPICRVTGSDSSSFPQLPLADENLRKDSKGSQKTLREALLSYVTSGEDDQVFGSLSLLATLLQTKELDEVMLDFLGILPQRKQHKKLLLQALVGEGEGEEQLFSPESNSVKDDIMSEVDSYLHRLQDQYGLSCSRTKVEVCPVTHRFQVLDALVSVFSQLNISADTLWDAGWLLRQLLPYSQAEFNQSHLKLLQDSYKKCSLDLLAETRGIWPDLLITIVMDEWKKCKQAIEALSPRGDPRRLLLPTKKPSSEEVIPAESSIAVGERMYEMVKIFILLHQLQIFALGKPLPDQPTIHPPFDIPEISRAKTVGLDASGPKPGCEIKVVDAVPCRISFERGKDRHLCFLAVAVGISGWLILVEELHSKPGCGIVRVCAPLAGSNPKMDEKHTRWLHLQIRPSTFHHADAAKSSGNSKVKSNGLVDGRWTLAFRTEASCKMALDMVMEEICSQNNEVERRLQPLLELERDFDSPNHSL
ncbi:protein TRANSPARENT TESTA 9-like isoform X2 [Impatiens glandulifera]|uniref:protein TRANSPARENT TESTA 9-like isoform X2 n=1 Tax=Impatiens glandulifera TaxID=253017 RepID=UPI001FB0537F|nr:protein TRANSPARENT TESTA 9-like isoform X2 [Impatiens glandulifera]